MIKAEHVSMKFRVNQDHVNSLKEYVVAKAAHRLKYKDFWVFQDISFEIKKGQVAGIIGKNGAGKSTLLKIISGILTPTAGRVQLNGRVVPMLELGSGFDFELTGRENIFLNGSILGYSESFLKEKYDEIVAFSELEAFMETPIRNYSSGMMMRLAFSIATVVQPEILIVDEILAVGDESFQKKSRRRMLELMGGGTTVLFVSHSIAQIREMCDSVIWLENGRLKMQGETKYICDKYQASMDPDKEYGNRRRSDAHRNLSDVLFIYGKQDDKQAYDWRVTGQREQLLAGAVPTNEIDMEDICPDLAKLYRVFICVRCQETERMLQFLRYAKRLRKTVLYDFAGRGQDMQIPDPQELLYKKAKSEKLDGGVIVSNPMLLERYKEERMVSYNPPAVAERLLEYASWAVYDRDILPYCNADELSDEERVNYNRALAEQRKHAQDGMRIGMQGFFMSFDSDGGEYLAAESAVAAYVQRETHCKVLIWNTADWHAIQKASPLSADRLVRMEQSEPEDLLRSYAQADVVLLTAAGEEWQDNVLETWILASLVKVPCFCILSKDMRIPQPLVHGKTVWLCMDLEKAAMQLHQLLVQKELQKQLAEQAHACVHAKYSCFASGSRFGQFIRKIYQPNLAVLISDLSCSRSNAALRHAAVMMRQGSDITVLVTGRGQEDVEYDGIKLPVVSRDVIYSYQYFDTMCAFDWKSVLWMQNYGNVGRRIYFVQDYEPDDYKPGNLKRLQAVQMYRPHTQIQFAAASAGCRKWLKEKFGQDALLVGDTPQEIRELYRKDSREA